MHSRRKFAQVALDTAKKADIEVEKFIIKTIRSEFPEHKFLGEETFDENAPPSNDDYTWIIDPTDGTTNFVQGISLFGTQIALAYKEKYCLGF